MDSQACQTVLLEEPQPNGLVVQVILGKSGSVNGVDQLRLDVVSRLPMKVNSSSAFFHVLLGSFFTTHFLRWPRTLDRLQ